jgi:hypothetical protein
VRVKHCITLEPLSINKWRAALFIFGMVLVNVVERLLIPALEQMLIRVYVLSRVIILQGLHHHILEGQTGEAALSISL